ncbi:MAG: hypothetical protein ACK46L_07825 [Synechococcaceae cyanobacterium]
MIRASLSHGTVAHHTVWSRGSFDLRFAASSAPPTAMGRRLLGQRPSSSRIAALCPSLTAGQGAGRA